MACICYPKVMNEINDDGDFAVQLVLVTSGTAVVAESVEGRRRPALAGIYVRRSSFSILRYAPDSPVSVFCKDAPAVRRAGEDQPSSLKYSACTGMRDGPTEITSEMTQGGPPCLGPWVLG